MIPDRWSDFLPFHGPIDPYSFLGQSIHSFLWRDGAMRDVGTLGGPDTFPGFAHHLTGVVVGASFTNSTPNPTTGIPTLHPFLWKDGHMRDLGTLGGTLCCQEAVVANSRGQVASDSTLAGDLQSHPFLWDKGELTDLGTLGGDNGSLTGSTTRERWLVLPICRARRRTMPFSGGMA